MNKQNNKNTTIIAALAVVFLAIIVTFIGGNLITPPNQDEKTYKIGETFSMEQTEYTINSIKFEQLNQENENLFLIININIKNNNDKEIKLSPEQFKLEHNQKKFSTSLILEDNGLNNEKLNPGISIERNIYFSIDEKMHEAENLYLNVTSDYWEKSKALVKLS